MNFSKFLKIAVGLTFLLLLHINMQMQIIHLSYAEKVRENTVRDLLAENGVAKYKILSLRSAHHLGTQMLAENSNMNFADFENIIELKAPQNIVTENKTASAVRNDRNNLLSFLNLGGASAEAKIHE